MLLIVGGVNAASATEYYIGAEINSTWSIQDAMSNDGNGTYSYLLTLPEQTGVYFTIFTSNAISWDDEKVYRPNNDGNAWITNEINEISMLETGGNGVLYYPINENTSKNNARYIKISYTPSTKILRVTRYISVASAYNGWSTNTDLLEETSCGSKIYTGYVTLRSGNEENDGFKFVYIDNGKVNWGGKNNNGYINNETGNFKLNTDGIYFVSAQFNDWSWTDPVLQVVPVSVSSYGVATFCSNYPLDFTGIEDVKAYTIIASDKATGALAKSQVTGKVAAGTGLYLEGTANASVNVPTTIYTESAGTNMLVGALSDTGISQIDGENTNYILTVNTKNGNVATPKFYKVNSGGNTVLANRAYLQIPTKLASRESFWFEDGEATTIESAKQEQSLNGVAFNLAGQRIAQPTKGLYIVNGKKIIMK